jgi:hypothetical protein
MIKNHSIRILYGCIVIFSIASVLAQDFDHQKLNVCKEFKAISPHAHPQSYKALAAKLNYHNLNACSCIRDYLLVERKNKVHGAIEKKFNLPSTIWKKYDQDIEQLKESHKQTSQKVTFDHSIKYRNPSLRQYIEKKIKELGIVQSIDIVSDLDVSYGEVETTFYQQSLFGTKKILRLNKIEVEYGILGRPQGIALHELHHIHNYHAERINLLERDIGPFSDENRSKYQRLREAEADRVPAACGSSSDSCFAESITSMLDLYEKKEDKSTYYPRIQKRLDWAIRIRKLKEAEEGLAHDQLKANPELKAKKQEKTSNFIGFKSMNHFH